MKIGIFDPYLDTLGGGEKYMLALAMCLSEKHDVSLFWDREKGVEIKSGAMRRFGFNLDTIHFSDNIFSAQTSFLKRLWESQKYDVIVYLSDGSIPFMLRKNLVIHFQFPIEWIQKSLFTKIKLLRVKSIICNSQFTKYYIDKKLNVQSNVIYPPVSLHINVAARKEDIILHVGRFGISREGENFKKQDVMVDVFKQMIKKKLVAGWRFVMVISVKADDKDKIGSLRDLAKGYPIEIIVNPSNEKLWEMYSAAKIYWHASGYGEDLGKYPERAEHFGIATAEAMGAGTVPVVINAGGQPEIVVNEENGYLWNTEEELIEKTKRLILDQKLWMKFSVAGKESVKKFNTKRFSDEVKQIVDSG